MDTTVSTDPNNITSGRPLLVGPSQPESPYPIFVSGNVVQGFGRGGKQLGIPTANLPESAVAAALQNIPIGVYYGWAQVQHGEVRPMVMSLGWNPYFKNEKRSGEVHIIHGFEEDFYGQEMRVAILGFVREEKDYKSLEDLVADIRFDIRVALKSLEREAYLKIKDDQFFFQKLVE